MVSAMAMVCLLASPVLAMGEHGEKSNLPAPFADRVFFRESFESDPGWADGTDWQHGILDELDPSGLDRFPAPPCLGRHAYFAEAA